MTSSEKSKSEEQNPAKPRNKDGSEGYDSPFLGADQQRERAEPNDEPREGGKHGQGNDQSDRAERGDGADHWFEADTGQRAPLRAGGVKPQEGDRADGQSGKDAPRIRPRGGPSREGGS